MKIVDSYKDGGESPHGRLWSGMSGLNCESGPVLGRVCLYAVFSGEDPRGESVWTGPRSVLGHQAVSQETGSLGSGYVRSPRD